jgi:hypothetical protein
VAIWAAASEADLPIMFHAFTIETPYFPGYRDIWDDPAMGRCAGQTRGGQRFVSFMLMGGMLDRLMWESAARFLRLTSTPWAGAARV